MTAREVHPVADLFPMLADDELRELAEDIKQRGLLQPVVLDAEGRVLDGRNRLAACELAGIEPRFTTGDVRSVVDVLAFNGQRIELTAGKRAIIAARASKLEGLRGSDIARALRISESRVSEARTIVDYAEDLVDRVLDGTMPLIDAYREAQERRTLAEAAKAAKVRIRDEDPDLLALVEDGRLSVDDAMATLDARETKARQEAEARRNEDEKRAAEAAAKAARISESLRMAINTLIKGFGTDELRQQIANSYVQPGTGSEVNQNITATELAAAAEVCSDLADRWETP